MISRRLVGPLASALAALTAVAVTACAADADVRNNAADGFPVTVEHAFGSTTVHSADRIATVGWSNQEVPLALGVVPVGMASVTWGDDDDDGILPWVRARLDDLGADTPARYDETDGPDYEAVSDADPDLILAAYSGLTEEQYTKLTKIAPVIAYPKIPWGTPWDETIELNATAMGRKAEGAALIADLRARIDAAVGAHPELAAASTMFAYLDPTDMSKIGFYTLNDPRAEFLRDAGLPVPAAVTAAGRGSDEFYREVSAEQADRFDDVDLIVTYGDEKTLARLQADPLLGKIPAVKAGHVAVLPDSTPLASASNPTALSIPAHVDEYFGRLAAALTTS
ncbi:iron-siderophore ABC transporter substrate-binding protein [Gordonia shandongensis]|uniref:iron-siderophore ABC transporter substrate-binding protein n=1 Tax=Gordonia shandongensis TaxID=376351 RepID=UPI0004206E8C|nr:iron-siderophore ABC transporter substrate-binding protein [Gordonia shandongensis]